MTSMSMYPHLLICAFTSSAHLIHFIGSGWLKIQTRAISVDQRSSSLHICKSLLPLRRNLALTPQSAVQLISTNISRKLLAKDDKNLRVPLPKKDGEKTKKKPPQKKENCLAVCSSGFKAEFRVSSCLSPNFRVSRIQLRYHFPPLAFHRPWISETSPLHVLLLLNMAPSSHEQIRDL